MTTMTTSAATSVDAPAPRRTSPYSGIVVLVVVTAVAATLPFLSGPYYQQIGYQLFQLVALATAWNLLAGYTGLASLGSGAFVGLGVYASVLFSNGQGWALPLLLVSGGVVSVAFAVLVSPALFRLRGLYFTVATLALSEALRILAVNSKTFKGASGIVLDAAAPDFYLLYWVVLGIAAISTLLVGIILRTPASLSLRSIRDDEDVAQEMGVPAFRTKLWAFAISAFIMGMVGALQTFRVGVVEPYSSFGLIWTVQILTVAIVGGLGTQVGPWVGALLVVIVNQLLRDAPEVQALVSGVVIILVIRFAPRGIWGTFLQVRGGRRDRRAKH